jgi:hypothetical protein
MDLQELTQELIAFLYATEQYQSFLDWGEDRGYDRYELDTELERVQEF